MISILYLGYNEKIVTLLESKKINVATITDVNKKCIFTNAKYHLILVEDSLYSQYLEMFSCLNHTGNVIVLYKKNNLSSNTIHNYNNVSNYYDIDYFLDNLDLLFNFYIYKENNRPEIYAEYVNNYTHLEQKLINKKTLINIHLYDLGYYYKNYGYAFLKYVVNEFIDGLLKSINEGDNLYILGQSDFFITSSTKSKQQLELIAKQIINYFKVQTFTIHDISIKFKFKIALSYDENSLALISKTLNNLNNTNEYNFLNNEFKDTLFLQQQENIVLAKKIKDGYLKDKFTTYYQPIIDNEYFDIVMYECLIRHKDSELQPNEFIPALQKAGLTSLVTYTIIDQAFAKLSGEKQKISINICVEDLENTKLINYIKEKQKKYGIASNRIIFEVVESFSSTNNSFVISQLKTLKENGYEIALDDFGINDSNFSVLFELNIDYIKIDGAFISKLEIPKYYKIVNGLVALAKSIDVKIIAEFVDTEKIHKLVKELGIQYAQGYHIGRPSEMIDKEK